MIQYLDICLSVATLLNTWIYVKVCICDLILGYISKRQYLDICLSMHTLNTWIYVYVCIHSILGYMSNYAYTQYLDICLGMHTLNTWIYV